MNWGILKDVVEKYAPTLANLIPGPFGPIISVILAHAFNIQNPTPDSLLAAISSDPDAGIKLKGLELEHEDLLAKLNASDTADARQHDVDMEKIGMKWFVPILAIIVIVGFFILTLFIAFDKVNASEYQMLYMLLGQLSSGFTLVLGFYFGSSNNQYPIKK